MSRLILVRHGQTEWYAENRYAGSSDVSLTAEGRAQAEQLARWAADAQLAGVWSSPLSRARLTAAPAARAAKLPLREDARLRELGFGQGEGLTVAEMRARFPRERASFEEDPARSPLPGGENPEDAAHRGATSLEEIARAGGADARILVVAHSTLLRLVLCRLFGIPLGRYRTVFPSLDHSASTELEFTPAGVGLRSFNSPWPRSTR